MPTDSVVHQLAIRAGNKLRDEHLLLATAESCTGGMIAAAVTDISGSSQWFERGFVTYSNQAKSEMIGVPAELIAMDHVVLLPHVGSASVHTREQMGQLLVDNLVSWFDGKGPLTPVAETPWKKA